MQSEYPKMGLPDDNHYKSCEMHENELKRSKFFTIADPQIITVMKRNARIATLSCESHTCMVYHLFQECKSYFAASAIIDNIVYDPV